MDVKCTIKLHSARSSGARVVWPEVRIGEKETAESAEALARILGDHVRIEWALITGSGIRTPISSDDPRVEDDGFLLRIPEKDARAGYRAECTLVIDEQAHKEAE